MLLVGLQSHSSMHPCYLCNGYRVNKNGRKTTSKDGSFVVGQLRTVNTIKESNGKWRADTQHMSEKDAKSELKNYDSCQNIPIDIHHQLDVPLLFLCPPDPLHGIRYFCSIIGGHKLILKMFTFFELNLKIKSYV